MIQQIAFLKPALVLMVLVMMGCSAFAQSTETDKSDERDISGWYATYHWLNGLELMPHSSVNQLEFSKQYHKYPDWWDAAFKFLKTENLETLEPGRYVIVPDDVTAFVSVGAAKEKEEVNWETHTNFNDLQYIVAGQAGMGITATSNPNVKVATPYNARMDTETYTVEGGDYYVAEPGTFFIFSPKDVHRPAFKAAGSDTVKKILIKVRVP